MKTMTYSATRANFAAAIDSVLKTARKSSSPVPARIRWF